MIKSESTKFEKIDIDSIYRKYYRLLCLYALHYLHIAEDERKAIAMTNHSFQERIRKKHSIDIDFFDIEEKLGLPPPLDDGLFLKWEIAKQCFMKHLIKDSQGFTD